MKREQIRYNSIVCDSNRWEGFAFREGDIIISTPPKCGTTWTQTICALLIFQTAQLPKAVDVLSPWLDQTLRTRDSVVADLEAQEHRRFIKSHLPLDGLPWDERVTYICVGRDPRDVALSWDNHMDNLNLEAFLALRDKAVGLEDLAELMPPALLEPPPEDPRERFWRWINDETPLPMTVGGLRFLVHHVSSFWQERERPNVVMLHFADLKADLEGQMRSLAVQLGIDVPEERWEELVKAATFEEMKKHAVAAAPNATEPIWKDTVRFFNRGTNEQWRGLLDADDLRRYETIIKDLAEPELVEWLQRGSR
jgi:aryl sulfotransferase